MADKIKLLSELVANQIAAGEVVNRPASVIKEMMENSIDAGAQSVKVNFRDGGKELIQIVDDGCGMSPVDARLAFDRHATSKISSVDDIYALRTFGFRGEALASIAAVAQVELRTRQCDDEVGTQTEISGGEYVSQQPCMCPQGSQFYVRNLFFNVPARRRFLEKSSTSTTQIKHEFQRVALCNPKIHFELYNNDAPLYILPANTLAGRIVDIVGRHIKHNLLEVSVDTTIAKVSGYIGRPAAAKKRNSEQYLFVNGRFFNSSYIVKAIMRAYEKLIPESSHPSFFLYLEVDPSRVDVNVHPQKTEVKFADDEALWQIVHAAVRETLGKSGAIPMMDFSSEQVVDIPVATQHEGEYKIPRAVMNDNYNPFASDYLSVSESSLVNMDVSYSRSSGTSSFGGRLSDAGFSSEDSEFEDFTSSIAPQEEDLYESVESSVSISHEESSLEFVPSQSVQEQGLTLEAEKATFGAVISLSGGYVVAQYGEGVVLVDLRRAKERVLFESYRRLLVSGSSVSQQLLFPERLTLSNEEYATLEELSVEFASLGFDMRFLGDGNIEVNGTPADMPADEIDVLIYDLLHAFDAPADAESLRRDRIAATMAQKGSRAMVRGLSEESIDALLQQLQACENSTYTPQGRVIMSQLTAEDAAEKLEK